MATFSSIPLSYLLPRPTNPVSVVTRRSGSVGRARRYEDMRWLLPLAGFLASLGEKLGLPLHPADRPVAEGVTFPAAGPDKLCARRGSPG